MALILLVGKSFGRYKLPEETTESEFEEIMHRLLYPFLQLLIAKIRHLFPDFIDALPILHVTLAGMFFFYFQ